MPRPPGVPPRAHPDDEADLTDPWVFVDFWRRAGITYPDPQTHTPAISIKLKNNYDMKLPQCVEVL